MTTPVNDKNSGASSPQSITQSESGALEVPDSIVPNIRVARNIYERMRASHFERSLLYSEIEGIIAGNPPYDPDELAAHKLDHIANFNNFDARSTFDKAALAYWNLLNSAQTLIKFEFIDPLSGEVITDPQTLYFANIMAKNWDFEVKRWPSFITNFNTLFAQLVKFGLSPVIWPNQKSWKWEVIQLQRFFVASNASTDIEKLTSLCVETDQTLQFLYKVYDKENKKKEGNGPWDLKALKDVLLHHGKKMMGQTTDEQVFDFMEMQRRIQNGDASMDALYTDSIRLVSLFYCEYNGKITHIMFDRHHGEILYRAESKYDNFQEMMVILTSSPGEFELHSNVGVGHKLFSPCQATMRMDCSIVDMTQWASTPIIASPPNGGQNIEPIKFYPGVPTNIGVAQFQNNTLGANIQQLVGASGYLTAKLERNIANSGDDASIPDQNQGSISESQAKHLSFKEFGVLKHNISHTYNQVDLIYRNMVVKMLGSKDGYPDHDVCQRWKQRCIAAGVPEFIFDQKAKKDQFGMPHFLNCKATRVVGDGSTAALIMALEALEKIAPTFGPREAKEWKRHWILATAGPDYVHPFLQDSNDEDETAGGASLAAAENAIMQLGKAPLFSADNDQRGHIAQHLALGKFTVDGIQQQEMSPLDADPIFQMLIPHLEQHIQYISQDPFAQEFVAGIKKNWFQLQSYADLNRKNAARMMQAEIKRKQEAEQQQSQVMNKEQLDTYRAQQAEMRANMKQEGSERRANFASQNKAETARRKVETDADIKRRKVEADSGIKRLETHLKSANERLKETPLQDLKSQLRKMNGSTIAPYDIESN